MTDTALAPAASALDDRPLPVQARLAAAWASFMFFYVYVDYLHLYRPGALEEILAGRVFEFEANQTFATTSLALVGIPALMVALSAALPARANRMLNLAVATLYVPVSVFNLAGESWLAFYGLGVVVEVALLVFVLRWAWSWPRSSSAGVAAP
ncbi:DUF6326 family protein [Nocardioides KLBMP 9356]|uniref:DUF6326 family protein n=1 Tax=Nocardioides potassii TaxID=2911371 RepID=A0ABS9HHT1_9ACTN|nr:DUF6326 family protein [Nocardioides potassii]MCF6379775.1 DUF6326 family protein [Nocardioides potassii]